MHIVFPSKLKTLFLLPALLILLSFGDGEKETTKFPIAENSLSSTDFITGDDNIDDIIPEKENTFT